MLKLNSKRDRIRGKYLIIKVMLLNIIIFILSMLFFETTPKSDDYDMVNVLCGGVSGEYSPFVLYIHPLLGYVMSALTFLWPQAAWYYILQYILLILAFSCVAYILVERLGQKQGFGCHIILMIFCSYEFYVRITFSKTSGALIGIGLFILFRTICERRRLRGYIAGVGFVILGCLYRTAMLKLSLFMFFSAFLIFVLGSIKNKKINLKRIVPEFAVIVVCLLLCAGGMDYLKKFLFNNDKTWAAYLEYNTNRAALMDYEWADYDEHQKEYEAIGVSENDYNIWKNCADIADPDIFTESKIKQINSISADKQDMSLAAMLKEASEGLLGYLINNPLFIGYFCMCVLLYFSGAENYRRIIITVSVFYLFAYYYMFYLGRIQHHVDVSVSLAGCLLILYYCRKVDAERARNFKLQMTAAGLVLIFSVNYFYQDLTASSYYGTLYGRVSSRGTKMEENYEKLSLLSEDEENLYLLEASETNNIYQCFSTFEPIESGFYHNIFMLNQIAVPVFRDALKNYNIENPFSEIVNNPNVYYCTTEKTDRNKEFVLQYIQEHYNEEAYYTLVKEVEGLNVYRFNEGEIQVDLNRERLEPDKVLYDAVCTVNDSAELVIEGYAYVQDLDSYSQNIYIEAEHMLTGEKEYYYALQKENRELSSRNKNGGKYSAFSATVPIMEDEGVQYSVIIENEEGVCEFPLMVEEG